VDGRPSFANGDRLSLAATLRVVSPVRKLRVLRFLLLAVKSVGTCVPDGAWERAVERSVLEIV
jgi:hypothetical protein